MMAAVVSVDLTAFKWYSLNVLHASGLLEEVPFPDMGDYEILGSPYVDHAPNPRHVCAWASQQGFEVDYLSLEMMIGRWELESGEDRYKDLHY